jgi:transcriptional regulator with XRE-family HTH domain
MNSTATAPEENKTLKSFTSFMKEKRLAKGWNQQDLANAINATHTDTTIDRQSISNIERGFRKGITLETMDKILTALNSGIEFKEF